MSYYERALALKEETIAHRRYLHAHAEIGFELPKTKAYIMDTLRACGIQPKECGQGITATLGQGGKVFLLRADIDALPMKEESGESFACPTGTAAHACGHDFHAAMLLTAAKLLKETESQLSGRVKLMFQPAEETLQGSQDMIAHGILDHPAVDAALAIHVSPGQLPVGTYMYNSTGTMMNSADGFTLTVHGRGTHGAYPHAGIDPIAIGAHIHLALEGLIARETDPKASCMITIGQFQAGTTSNIIPDTAILRGSIRTNDPASRTLLVRRMKEVAQTIAKAYGGTVDIHMTSQVPPLICDPSLTEELVQSIQALNIPSMTPHPNVSANASEDFASIAERVPSAFFYLSAGYLDERGTYPAHNPKVQFNEEVCPIGSSCLAHCAAQWLKHHCESNERVNSMG